MRVVLALLLLAPLRAQEPPAWKTIELGLELRFPRDHGSHPEYRTEWWYLTGLLEDEAGARFGFQFTVFRRGLQPGAPRAEESPLRARQVFAGHLALSEVARGQTRFAERLQRNSPLATAAEGDLALALGDWSLRRAADDELALVAADPEQAFGFDFRLRPEKPLVLHGERGYSRKGPEPGNASAYVSWPRLALTGRLTLDGRALRVHGGAWYDHEFGSGVLPEGTRGWDWFGLRLDDSGDPPGAGGRELMLFVLRGPDGVPREASAATLVERDGTTRGFAQAQFTLTSHALWQSPTSGASYPARWTIALPAAGLRLEIAPLVPDCELESHATGISYWEGPVTVSGVERRIDGTESGLAGRGYAELTGYAGSLAGRF